MRRCDLCTLSCVHQIFSLITKSLKKDQSSLLDGNGSIGLIKITAGFLFSDMKHPTDETKI